MAGTEKTTLTVGELAEKIGAELLGSDSVQITGVNALEAAGQTELTFVTENKYLTKLTRSEAAAVILAEKVDDLPIPQLIVKDVSKALAEALNIFAPKLQPPTPGIHPSAVVDKSVLVGEGVSIGPNVYIGADVEIGDNTIISSGCSIEQGSKIGSHCCLYANVVVYHNCIIGNHVIIQANTAIGSIGFGYFFADGGHQHTPHNGAVIIEDHVDIGSCTCVDRAKFGNTVIGAGTKIDNLVQIGHNVIIGKCCLLSGQVGIAGSSRLGDGAVLGGQVGIGDHVTIGDGTKIGAQSGIARDVESGKEMLGSPAFEVKQNLRQIFSTARLPELAKQVKKLSKKVETLEASKNDS